MKFYRSLLCVLVAVPAAAQSPADSAAIRAAALDARIARLRRH